MYAIIAYNVVVGVDDDIGHGGDLCRLSSYVQRGLSMALPRCVLLICKMMSFIVSVKILCGIHKVQDFSQRDKMYIRSYIEYLA